MVVEVAVEAADVVDKNMKKINLKIKGMHCSSCAKLIVSELEDKVAKLKVEDNGNASVEFDEKRITEQQIKDIIKELGYQA